MSTVQSQDSRFQNKNRIRRLTLGFGVLQTILGLALTALSFITFFSTEADRIRNSCPYWAGFMVCCSGGVGIIAWRRSSVFSMGLFTFFSAVCVVLQMIGTIFTGDIGGILKSVIMCRVVGSDVCVCCDTITSCQQDILVYRFEGISDCSIVNGLLKELMFGLCVLNIFGSLLCFTATVLGCTAVVQCTGRDQIHFRRHNSERSTTVTEDPSSWLPYSRDLDLVLSYAPPMYHSVDNLVREFGTTPYIVPPPVFDPTDLPPPYSSGNPSLANSHCSLRYQDGSVCSYQCSRRESYRTSLYTHHSAFSAQVQASDVSGEEFLQTRIPLRDNFLGSCNASICSQPLERDDISCREEGASVDLAEGILQEEFVENTRNNTGSAVSTTDSDAGSTEGSTVWFVSCGGPNKSKELINLSDSQNVCHSVDCTSDSISPLNRDMSTTPPNLSLDDCEGVPARRPCSACESDSSLHLRTLKEVQSQPLREYSHNLNSDIVRTSPNTAIALQALELADNSFCSRHAIKERSICGAPNVKCRKAKSSGREKQKMALQGEFSEEKNEKTHEQRGQIKRPVSVGETKTALSCSKETIV